MRLRLRRRIGGCSAGRASVARALIGSFSAVLALSNCAAIAQAGTPGLSLSFGTYASDKPSAMVEQLRPTLNILQQELSKALHRPVHIKFQVARDYQTGVQDLVAGRVDFARLGAASYVLAKDQAPGIDILAAERFGDAKSFEGVICVGDSSGITSLAQLKGKSFAFGSEDSTIGRFMAQLYLARAGITAGELKSYQYLERHDRVGMAVGAGQFDAGALEGTIFAKLVAAGVPIRPLASFRAPTKAWVARVGLDASVKAELRRALLAVKDPKALAALRFDGFLPADDADYSLVRAAMKENRRFFRTPSSS